MASNRKVRRFLRQWLRRYPFPGPWIDARANRLCRKSEAQWLAQFVGAATLKRRDVVELVAWRFADQPQQKEWALVGVTGPSEWGHARRCIKKALATSNPTAAVDCMLAERGGITGWGPEMASVVLAVCDPASYPLADVRMLASLRSMDLLSSRPGQEFLREDWWPYLQACRKLARVSGLSIREVSQALWASADEAPKLPGASKLRKRKNKKRKDEKHKSRKSKSGKSKKE